MASTKAELAKRLGGLVVFEEDDDAYYDEDEGDEAPFTFHNSNWSDKAIEINDDVDISDKMREYRLRPILRKMGFDVKFVGPTDNE